MRKFTGFEDTKKETTMESKINQLLETLTIEVEGEEKPWEKNIVIKSTPEFQAAIQQLAMETYLKERLAILEKAKNSHFTGDISWISDEIELVKESLKK
jgi:hypothetical protein